MTMERKIPIKWEDTDGMKIEMYPVVCDGFRGHRMEQYTGEPVTRHVFYRNKPQAEGSTGLCPDCGDLYMMEIELIDMEMQAEGARRIPVTDGEKHGQAEVSDSAN